MKRHIILIIFLMAVCVLSVIGLQLFWNYQNYRSTVKNFDHDINEALHVAVDRELDFRQQIIINQVMHWMSDTSFINITCSIKNRNRKTVFQVRDRHPYDPKEKGFSISINEFKQQLTAITPSAKQYFIHHFATNIVRRDLKKGFIYYYTQRLGDSLQHTFFISKLNLPKLQKLYAQELRIRNIRSSFSIQPGTVINQSYLTQPVNASMRRPYEKEWVRAGFESSGSYFFREMKWIILATLVLVVVVVVCFGYTTKTLLSQHRLSELKNNFVNNMTHELNTPLASIKITVEALSKFNHDPVRLSEYLAIIDYQTDKLTDLTTQILNTNKLVKPNEKAWRLINLNLLFEESVGLLAPKIQASNILLKFEPYYEDIMVKGEPSTLLNAVSNIIDNALKYCKLMQPQLDIQIIKQERYAELRFTDNGPGIPEQYRYEIFEPFFRVPQGDQHDVKGYGLGLSYVKQVIEVHRGKISVYSNQPQGCIFMIQLPLA